MISWRNLTEKARVINNIVNTIDRKIAIIDFFIFKEIFVVRLKTSGHQRGTRLVGDLQTVVLPLSSS